MAIPTWVQTDLFGGTGEVRIADLLSPCPLTGFAAILDCTLAPGASVGVHVQQDHDEAVGFTGGQGLVGVDGVPRQVTAGDVVSLPLGATLALSNAGAAPLRYVILKA